MNTLERYSASSAFIVSTINSCEEHTFFKSATAPCIAIFPLFKKATSVQIRSTSDKICVENNTVVCFLEESRISSISFLPIGSSAEVGSSQIKILGRPRSACAIPSRCFIPLENPLIR